MRFGLSLCPEVGRWHDTVEQARAAEDLGFDSVWLPEHHLMAGYAPSPLLGLAGLASVTNQVTLGTDVVVAPFYHPVRLAEDAALLHEMSGERLLLGVGLGYRREEFSAFGVPYSERGARFTEILEVIRALWSHERVTYAGQFFQLHGVTIYPRLTRPPKLLVGGWSDAAIRRAATYGDAYFPGPTADVDTVRRCLDRYDGFLAAQGQIRTELPIFRELWVAEDPQHLAAGMAPLHALYESDYRRWGHDNVADVDNVSRDRFLVGDAEQVAAQVVDLARRLGVTELVARLHFHGSDHTAVLRSMRLLAEKVRPAVEKALR